MAVPESPTVIASEVNKFDWLTLEALWATAKVPFPTQWESWQNQKRLSDPDSSTGRVIGGNLDRARSALVHGDAAKDDPQSQRDFRARAIVHCGKMAGGLISMVAHFDTPPVRWGLPLQEHLAAHFDASDLAIEHAETSAEITWIADKYYEQLQMIHAAVRRRGHNPRSMQIQADRLIDIAGTAVKTWASLLEQHPDTEFDQGATPRSGDPANPNDLITALRIDFEQYVPRVHEAARLRTIS